MRAVNQLDNEPLSQLSLSVFRLNGFLTRSGEAITRPIGQSSARWQLLGRVAFESQTVAQIARNMGNARQSVQRVANALERDGLIVYKTNPSDKRAPLLELTPAGKKQLEAIYASYGAWLTQTAAKLDGPRVAQLATALNEVAEILESTNKE